MFVLFSGLLHYVFEFTVYNPAQGNKKKNFLTWFSNITDFNKKKTSFHKICYEQGQDEHEKTIKITKKFGTARQNEKKHLTYLRFVTGFVELPKCN